MEDVEFTALDGLTIRGSFLKADRPRAVCLFLHGITTDRAEYLNFHFLLATQLLSLDVSSLLIDFRGHGKSDGDQLDFSPMGQVLDTISSINFLDAQPGLDQLPLTIFGTSFGAGPAILSTAELRRRVSQIFLVAPVLDYRRTFLEPTTAWASASFNEQSLRQIRKTGYLVLDNTFRIGLRLVCEMENIDLVAAARSISQPLFILHGQEDSMVPVQTSIDFARKIPHSTLILMPKMDHGFSAPGDDEGTTENSKQNLDQIGHHLQNSIRNLMKT